MTIELVKGATADKKLVSKCRKPTAKLVAQLESELAQVREALTVATDGLIKKNDELVQARNERDEARDERDALRNARDLINHWAQKDSTVYERTIRELDIKLIQVREANEKLISMNQHNADVAAILVSCVVAATHEGPVPTMTNFLRTAGRMGVSSEVLDDVRTAFKRGYVEQVEQTMDRIAGAIKNPSSKDTEGLIDI